MLVARRILASLALSLLAGCASTQQSASPNDAAGAAPALFVARDADSTLYLYGTIHLRREGDAWGGPHVEAALTEADEVWTEVDVSPASLARAQSEAMRLGLSADRTVSGYLDEGDQQRLAALTESLGIPNEALSRMRPWMAALTLSVVPMVRAGYDPDRGVDRAVVAWGSSHNKTLRSFETPEQQIGFFASLDEETQGGMLRQAIEGGAEGVEVVNAMSAAWDRGDGVALESQIVSEVRTSYPLVYQAFFVARNNAWMEVIARELDGAGVDFVAVGAGHVYGPDGLIAQLRARGVRVERVQ